MVGYCYGRIPSTYLIDICCNKQEICGFITGFIRNPATFIILNDSVLKEIVILYACKMTRHFPNILNHVHANNQYMRVVIF